MKSAKMSKKNKSVFSFLSFHEFLVSELWAVYPVKLVFWKLFTVFFILVDFCIFSWLSIFHYSAQASYFAVFAESGTRKLRKVMESRTKFLFDVKRVLDSTTVLVLDSTPILLL